MLTIETIIYETLNDDPSILDSTNVILDFINQLSSLVRQTSDKIDYNYIHIITIKLIINVPQTKRLKHISESW